MTHEYETYLHGQKIAKQLQIYITRHFYMLHNRRIISSRAVSDFGMSLFGPSTAQKVSKNKLKRDETWHDPPGCASATDFGCHHRLRLTLCLALLAVFALHDTFVSIVPRAVAPAAAAAAVPVLMTPTAPGASGI